MHHESETVARSLQRAVRSGRLAEVEALINQLTLPSCHDLPDGDNLLCSALQTGHYNVAKFLIKKGAKVSRYKGYTSLHAAAEDPHVPLEVAQMLINDPLLIDVQDKVGCTPLHYAAQVGNEELGRLLLRKGASNFFKNVDGWTPLYCAARGGYENVVEILIENGASVDATDNDGWTPLHWVTAYERNEEIVRLLLSQGASLSLADKNGRTPLHSAALEGHQNMVEILIENGASVKATDNNGWTPLHFAASRNHKSIVELLLNNEATVNALDTKDNTPLNTASGVDVMRVLLEFDADIDTQDELRRSPLHASTIRGDFESVLLLLSSGADTTLKDQEGQTALELSVSQQSQSHDPHDKIVDVLRRHILKLSVAKLGVSERDLSLILNNYDDQLQGFEQNCRDEVNKMKEERLCCHLTVYDTLKNRHNPLFARNETLMQKLTSCSAHKFPLYHTVIMSLMKRMKPRLELLKAARNALKLILKLSNDKKFNLPNNLYLEKPVLLPEILHYIVQYLSSKDLQNLILLRDSLLGT